MTINWTPLSINNTEGTFYTDSNALEAIQRVGNYNSQTAANFFPIDAFVIVQDSSNHSCIVVQNEVSEAGSGYNNGRVELIINRRIFSDDKLGMSEPLNERN